MKRKIKYDFLDGGFKFRYIDGDYDYCHAKSVRYKYHKNTWRQAMQYKADNEHDFAYAEHDCTGSTQVRIDVKRKGKYMYIYFHWYKDV